MQFRKSITFLLLLVGLASFAALQAGAGIGLWGVSGHLWLVTLGLTYPPWSVPSGYSPRLLRNAPILLWLIALFYLCGVIGLWLLIEQPAYNKPITPLEYAWLLSGLWGLFFILLYASDEQQWRRLVNRLVKAVGLACSSL